MPSSIDPQSLKVSKQEGKQIVRSLGTIAGNQFVIDNLKECEVLNRMLFPREKFPISVFFGEGGLWEEAQPSGLLSFFLHLFFNFSSAFVHNNFFPSAYVKFSFIFFLSFWLTLNAFIPILKPPFIISPWPNPRGQGVKRRKKGEEGEGVPHPLDQGRVGSSKFLWHVFLESSKFFNSWFPICHFDDPITNIVSPGVPPVSYCGKQFRSFWKYRIASQMFRYNLKLGFQQCHLEKWNLFCRTLMQSLIIF